MGHRPQLLYLPGMDVTGHLFYRQAVELEDLFDISVFGTAPDPAETWAGLALAACKQIDPTRPIILCGESFGACLALEMVCQPQYPWAGMILVNPASSFQRGPWWLQAWRLLPLVPDPLYQLTSRQGLGILAATDQIHPRDQDQLADAAYTVPPAVVVRRLQLLSEFKTDHLPLEKLRIPVLLIAGACDRLLPSLAEVERLAKRIPQSTIAIAPNSGHACLLERGFSLRTFIQQGSFLNAVLKLQS